MYCWIACALWGTERIVRTSIWFYINGFTQGLWFTERQSKSLARQSSSGRHSLAEKFDSLDKEWTAVDTSAPGTPFKGMYPPSANSSRTLHDPRDNYFGGHSPNQHSVSPSLKAGSRAANFRVPESATPAGFALIQLLPGRMMRLTVKMPRRIRWKTGQHVSVTVPSVHWWQGHPYTIACCDDRIS